MPISGLLCVYGFDGGWPSVFYVFGIVGALWSLAWLTVASDSPGEHRWMATKERDYIQQSLKGQISEKVRFRRRFPENFEFESLSFVCKPSKLKSEDFKTKVWTDEQRKLSKTSKQWLCSYQMARQALDLTSYWTSFRSELSEGPYAACTLMETDWK